MSSKVLENTSVLYDISVPIFPEMPTFPGDPGVIFEPTMVMDTGAPANVTTLHLGSQTGTHYDAPHHILNNGITMDQLPLDTFYGAAQVIEIPESVQAIDARVLSRYPLGQAPKLLLKTRNSGFWQTHPTTFRTDYAALTADGAEVLAAHGIRLIGIDYLSVELYGTPDLPAHNTLMHHNILILEGINLSDVSAGLYTLMAFPIAYQGLDGAPTRAVLLKSPDA